jgi:hypothetical protein
MGQYMKGTPFEDKTTDEEDAVILLMRGIQTDHLVYGLVRPAPGYEIAEQVCDAIIREKINPNWKGGAAQQTSGYTDADSCYY